jgi:hypothetical protein
MITEAPVCLASLIISKLKRRRRNWRETICEHYDNKETGFYIEKEEFHKLSHF